MLFFSLARLVEEKPIYFRSSPFFSFQSGHRRSANIQEADSFLTTQTGVEKGKHFLKSLKFLHYPGHSSKCI